MLLRQLFDHTSSTYTYLLSGPSSQEAVIIDPVKEHTESYLQLLGELNLTLVASIETHTHADHITASGLLREQTQCQLMMGEQSLVEKLNYRVSDNEHLDIAGLTIKVIYTPGHTDDSYSFLVNEHVFTGDTLMIRGTGRTDFQNGDAKAQYDSLFHRLLTLPEHTRVYPAHDYKGCTMSTIGEEKRFNPRLQVDNVDQYCELMDQLNLARPKLMDVAVPANLKCGMVNNV